MDYQWQAAVSVDPQRVGLHGSGGVIERVRVLGGLTLQLTVLAQSARPAVTEKPVVSDELHVMSRMASVDTVDADCVTLRCVACPAPVGRHIHI